MNTPRLVVAAGIVMMASSAFAEQSVIPERYPADRYQKMNEDSPFALATVAAPVAEPVKDWAADYYLGGIAKSMVDGKEELFVGIKSRNAQEQFTLFGTEPRNGISVVGIEWSDKIADTRVQLKKGSETATVRFDEINQAQPAAPIRPPNAPGVPNQLGNVRTMARPPGSSATIPPVPRPAAVQPSFQQPLPVPVPNTNNTNNPPQQPRGQRVRVIKSQP